MYSSPTPSTFSHEQFRKGANLRRRTWGKLSCLTRVLLMRGTEHPVSSTACTMC